MKITPSILKEMGVQLLRAVQHPSVSPRLAGLGYALALLVLSIAILALWFALAPRKRTIKKVVRYWVPDGEEPPDFVREAAAQAAVTEAQDAPEATDVAQDPEQPALDAAAKPKTIFGSAKALLSALLVPAMVLGAFVAIYVETSDARVCVVCHGGTPAVASATKDSHAQCSDCHSRPLPYGIAGNVADRVRMGIAQVRGDGTVTRESVDAVSCLKCHQKQLKGTIESTSAPVLMKHAEPLAAGMSCTECHGQVGHRDARQPVSMSRCLGCHDGKRASAKCSTCHTTDVGRTGVPAKVAEASNRPTGRLSYPPVRIGDIDCSGCHQVKTQCDTCHKIRMPHSTRFISGYHAKEAAFGKKKLCWRCHQETDCSGCHRVPFAGGHNSTWEVDHKKAPTTSSCLCHMGNTRNNAAKSMCDYCHKPGTLPKTAVPATQTPTSASR